MKSQPLIAGKLEVALMADLRRLKRDMRKAGRMVLGAREWRISARDSQLIGRLEWPVEHVARRKPTT